MRLPAILLLLVLSGCVGIYADPERTVILTPVGPIEQPRTDAPSSD